MRKTSKKNFSFSLDGQNLMKDGQQSWSEEYMRHSRQNRQTTQHKQQHKL